jgi:diguanylate cyclase (GGDEF)-like protein
LACVLIAWWLVGQLPQSEPGPAVGLTGVLLMAIALVWLWRNTVADQREIHRARIAAGLAFEHENAMQQAQQDASNANGLLVDALDALPIGIAIYDAHDRQVIRNRFLGQMFPGMFTPGSTGDTLESVLRRELALGLLAGKIDDPEQWVAQRLARRAEGTQPILQEYANGRWIHTYEVHTPKGFTVVARAEVTDLVRKEQLLAQANENLSRQSTTDGLTGIANRRKFDATLSAEWQRAARAGNSLSLLLVDIDHFKRYNDHYGHVAGDECLRRVTHVLASCVRRAGELLARYGGEEFVLLLPGADLAHARDLAQRCLNAIHREHIPHGASPTLDHVTFSIGVAQTFPTAAQDAETLVNAADTAMYRAKMEGRARYEVAERADWEIDKDAPRSHAGALS